MPTIKGSKKKTMRPNLKDIGFKFFTDNNLHIVVSQALLAAVANEDAYENLIKYFIQIQDGKENQTIDDYLNEQIKKMNEETKKLNLANEKLIEIAHNQGCECELVQCEQSEPEIIEQDNYEEVESPMMEVESNDNQELENIENEGIKFTENTNEIKENGKKVDILEDLVLNILLDEEQVDEETPEITESPQNHQEIPQIPTPVIDVNPKVIFDEDELDYEA